MGMPSTETTSKTYTLKILHTNDLHGNVKNIDQRVQYLLEQRQEAEARNEIVFILDGGDVFRNASNDSSSSFQKYQWKKIADSMNKAKYDAMTLGNHELDYGSEKLVDFIQYLEFPVVSSNLVVEKNSPLNKVYEEKIVEINESTKKAFGGKIYPGVIYEKRDVKIGIFGLTLPEANKKIKKHEGVQFKEATQTSVQMVKELRERGAEHVILISHMSDKTNKKLANHPEVVAQGGIDVIVGGHSHQPLEPGMLLNCSIEGESRGRKTNHSTVFGRANAHGQDILDIRIDYQENTSHMYCTFKKPDKESVNESVNNAKQIVDQPNNALSERLTAFENKAKKAKKPAKRHSIARRRL